MIYKVSTLDITSRITKAAEAILECDHPNSKLSYEEKMGLFEGPEIWRMDVKSQVKEKFGFFDHHLAEMKSMMVSCPNGVPLHVDDFLDPDQYEPTSFLIPVILPEDSRVVFYMLRS